MCLCARRAQADFLPVALVLGLSPGWPVEVPIVVIAEDGVTSLRYFLHIVRNMPPVNATAPASAASGGSRCASRLFAVVVLFFVYPLARGTPYDKLMRVLSFLRQTPAMHDTKGDLRRRIARTPSL